LPKFNNLPQKITKVISNNEQIVTFVTNVSHNRITERPKKWDLTPEERQEAIKNLTKPLPTINTTNDTLVTNDTKVTKVTKDKKITEEKVQDGQ